MFKRLRHKLHKLIEHNDTNRKKYKELHTKLQKKLHKIDGKTDKKSKEEIFILQKTIQKLEKKL